MKKQKGFTLIELLVVIAIIGILSTIVLVSLGAARNKANDAKMKGELSQLRADAELYYSGVGGGTYTGYTVPVNMTPPACSGDAAYQTGIAAQAYAIWADLCGDTGDWCVDSTGNSKAGTIAAGTTVCP